MKEIVSTSTSQTSELGYKLGKLCFPGAVICLNGDLGAGKTTMTKSIAKGLDVQDYVTSPTFTIVNEYEGRYPVYHFDVYRVSDIDEMYDIGYEEYIYSQGVCIIEWSNLIEEILPESRIEINISTKTQEERVIQIKAYGDNCKEILKNI